MKYQPNMCNPNKTVKCNLSYRECLKSRPYLDLKENGDEMKRQLKRNLTPLFSADSPDRLMLEMPNVFIGLFSNYGGTSND